MHHAEGAKDDANSAKQNLPTVLDGNVSGTTSSSCPKRPDWISFGLTAFIAFAVYLYTLAPDVTLGFAGIFAVGAWYGGVAHPPGYPLYTLYGWLITHLLPFSNVAWRLAVGSAIAAAVASGVIGLMVSRGGASMMEGIRGDKRLKPDEEKAVRVVSGAVAGLAFAFSGGVWGRAVIADTWTFNLLLLTCVFVFLMKWFYAPERKRFLHLGYLFFGFAFSNSQMLLTAGLGLQLLVAFGHPKLGRDIFIGNVILALVICLLDLIGWRYLPIVYPILGSALQTLFIYLASISFLIGLAFICTTRKCLTEWKTVLLSGLMFLLGLTPFLYLPVASMTNPPMNWGYARTVEGFFHTLSRGQYERIHPIDSLGTLFDQVGMYLEIATRQFGATYPLLALVPLWFLRRLPARDRSWLTGLFSAYVIFVLLLLVVLNIAVSQASIDIYWKVLVTPTYVLLSLLTGYGITLLLAGLALPLPEIKNATTA